MLDVLPGHDPYRFFEGEFEFLVPMPGTISLDGMEFAINLEKYKHMSQETMRDGAVTSSDQSEQLFNANGAWSRYRYSWIHGAGQEFADLREDADPFRFLHSSRINPWNDYELELHHAADEISMVTNVAGVGVLCESGGYLFYGAGTMLWRNQTIDTLSTWIPISMPGPMGTITAMTTDGSDLYVAHTNGVDRVIGGSTTGVQFTTDITNNTHSLAFVGNRLLAGMTRPDNVVVLNEIGNGGVLTLVKQHFQTGFRWTTLFNIGSRIYIGGVAGVRSELYSVATDSTGAIMQSVETAPLPAGELLRGGFPYAGVVLLLTNKGVRMAQPGGDGTLTYGPLITQGGDVLCATAEGQYAWVGWTQMTDGYSGCARIDLSTFVEPLLPAAAGEIRCGNVVGPVTSIARYNNRTAMALGSHGLWVESASQYEMTGTIDSGILTFGTVESKVLSEIKVDYEPLLLHEKIGVEIYDDLDALLGSFLIELEGSESFTYDLNAVQVRHCKVHIVLEGPGNSTPTLKQWRMRAYPVVPPVEQWIVPLRLSNRIVVNNAQGQVREISIEEGLDHILSCWRIKCPLTYRIGSRADRVRVDAFEFGSARWDDAKSFLNGELVVRLVKA